MDLGLRDRVCVVTGSTGGTGLAAARALADEGARVVVTGRDAEHRDAGTAATSVILRLKGAALFRVHDVAINVDALSLADAMLEREKPGN